MFYKAKKAQSVIEYSVLLAIILAVILIMQSFIKRHIQGGLKSAGEKISEEMFSGGGTTTYQKTTLQENQVIREEVATTDKIADFLPSGQTPQKTLPKGVYSFSDRSGKMTTDTKTQMDPAVIEKVRLSEFNNTAVDDFTSTDLEF
jgi:Flp pilus assembly pilin Flp